ncbi:MAG TPA: hypothetical protein VM687_10030 [Stenotrophomonas sp.]|nr:hypothetical protein [Stenotrophomonas sp.]
MKIVNCAFRVPVDLDEQKNCVRHYSDGAFSAFMFSNGTWAFSRGDVNFCEAEGRIAKLGDLRNFRVKEMDDGNFVVGFGEDFFAVVLRSELDDLRDELTKEVADLSEKDGEDILSVRGAPRDHLLIGLLARSRLVRDVEHPLVSVKLTAGD